MSVVCFPMNFICLQIIFTRFLMIFMCLYVVTGVLNVFYAHIEVLVTFLLVNFFSILDITRPHGGDERSHRQEIELLDVPHLPITLPDLNSRQEKKIGGFKNSKKLTSTCI